MSDGVTHTYLCRGLDATDDIAYITSAELRAWHHIHLQYAYFVGIILLSCIEELYLVAFSNNAIHHLKVCDDASERIEYGIENKCLQWGVFVTYWVGYTFYDGIQNLLYTQACLGTGTDDVFTITSQQFHDFVFHLVRHGIGHIALVDDGDDFQIMLQCHIKVGDGLCLHTLAGIDHQQSTLAGSDTATHFVAEIHVSRSVNEVEDVVLALVLIFHLDSVALDGNASLSLQLHVIEHLPFSNLNGISKLQQTVCQC